MRTAHQTAILIALLLVMSGENRARLSNKTVRLLGRRQALRSAFIVEVIEHLAEYGWIMFELPPGYGAIRARVVESARAATARRIFDADLRRQIIRDDGLDWSDLSQRAQTDQEAPEDEE